MSPVTDSEPGAAGGRSARVRSAISVARSASAARAWSNPARAPVPSSAARVAAQPGSAAAEVQVDLLNEAGGVGGHDVEYVVKELPTDPSGAQRAAQELLDEGVDAIIGPPFAYNGTPLIDTVAGRVPIISNASTDLALADRPLSWHQRGPFRGLDELIVVAPAG